jgi:hypothetical protein
LRFRDPSFARRRDREPALQESRRHQRAIAALRALLDPEVVAELTELVRREVDLGPSQLRRRERYARIDAAIAADEAGP